MGVKHTLAQQLLSGLIVAGLVTSMQLKAFSIRKKTNDAIRKSAGFINPRIDAIQDLMDIQCNLNTRNGSVRTAAAN